MKNDGKLVHGQRLHLTKWVPFLLIVAVAATACGTSISIDDDSVEITVPLSESAVNRLLRFSFVEQDDDTFRQGVGGGLAVVVYRRPRSMQDRMDE